MTALERVGLDDAYELQDGSEIYYSTVHNSWAKRWEEGGEPYSRNIAETEARRLIESTKEAGTMSEPVQYALILDNSYHAVVLRDLFAKEAQKHHTRWSEANTGKAARKNLELYEMYRELADRCEQIRLDVVADITKGVKV